MAGLVPAIDVLPAVIVQAFDCPSLRGAAEQRVRATLGPMTNSAESECDSVAIVSTKLAHECRPFAGISREPGLRFAYPVYGALTAPWHYFGRF